MSNRSRRLRARRSGALSVREALGLLALGLPLALGVGGLIGCVAFAAARSWGIA